MTGKAKLDITAEDKTARAWREVSERARKEAANLGQRFRDASNRGSHTSKILKGLDRVTFGRLGGQVRGVTSAISDLTAGASSAIEMLGARGALALGAAGGIVGLGVAFAMATKRASRSSPTTEPRVPTRLQSKLRIPIGPQPISTARHPG